MTLSIAANMSLLLRGFVAGLVLATSAIHALPDDVPDHPNLRSSPRLDASDTAHLPRSMPVESKVVGETELVEVVAPAHRRISTSDGVFQQVCDGVESTINSLCNQGIEVPVSASVGYSRACTNNCCDWNCGQTYCQPLCCTFICDRKCTKHWCCKGSWPNYKCGNFCEVCIDVPCTSCRADKCGETCINVPCTGCSKTHCGEKCEDIPDRLEVKHERKSYCDLLGVSGLTDAVEKTTKFCPCMDEVVKYLADGLSDVGSEGDPSAATSAALEAAASIVDCFIDNMDVRSEKADIMEAEKTRGGVNTIIVPGEEIGIKMYAQLFGAVVLCVNSGECGSIANVFLDLFENTAEKLGEGLVDALTEYIRLLLAPFDETLISAFKDLELKFHTAMTDCIEEVSTASRSISTNIETVYEDVKMGMKRIDDLLKQITETTNSIGPAIDAISTAIEAYSDSFMERIWSSITDGDIGELVAPSNAVDFIKNSKEIDNAIDGIKNIAALSSEVLNDVQNVQNGIKAIEDSIDEMSLMKFVCRSFSDGSLVATLSHVTGSLQSGLLDTTQRGLDSLKMEAGVASYSSFIDVQIENLPCSKMVLKTWDKSDVCPSCIAKAHVPEFYPCTASWTVPLPKEHTPFLRFVPGGESA